MSAKPSIPWRGVTLLLTILAISPLSTFAQCYLSQQCRPVDYLSYIPNGTGQIYHGDGASNNGAGGWMTGHSDVNQCLSCHYGTDTLPYLMTGHKNSMRKIAPGALWGGPDEALYLTTDDHYGSGSIYNWLSGQVTVGWCNPLGTAAQNGLTSTDAACAYPFYTLLNPNAPASYTPVAPTVSAGGLRNLYYVFGGWMNYGGSSQPAATQLNTVFDTGFTGELYPKGNFDCARCHTTGYNFDHSAPEPTSNTNNLVTGIPDAKLSRVPADGFVAPGTSGSSSWYLTGIQCERCHIAAWGYGSHPNGYSATVVQNEAATALCLECHREETIIPATVTPPGSITPAQTLQTVDRGYCSDLSGSVYSTCVSNPENQWNYKPTFGYGKGQEFLNSPHARFTGTLVQNAQHSSDLSITIAGSYSSYFSEAPTDPTKNSGCTGCHDPHQSTVAAANATKPIVNQCDTCHPLAANLLQTINHPMGIGTPFPTGTSADIPGACIVCHMQAALGRANSHLFRISSDANYYTFPTPAQLYTQGITSPATAPEVSDKTGATYTPATWLDVDLACGQCHVGNDGVTNPYGLTFPPGMPGAHAFTRTQLAYWASVMHPGDPGVPTPTFSPAPGTYSTTINVTLSDAQAGATIYYTLDGSQPNTSSPVYSTPISVLMSTTIRAMATYPGVKNSTIAMGSYNLTLPMAPAPTFSPLPSTYSSAISVSLANTSSLPMYYTLDGSTPTLNSTPYKSPIGVTQNTTIKAITYSSGYQASGVSIGNFYIQAPTPTFSPAAGTYYAPQSVTISDAVSAATIYYTTNGSIPTTGSPSCANPCSVQVAATTTLRAIASGGGYATSNGAFAAYTIAANNPAFSPAAGTYYTIPLTVTITEATSGTTIYYSTTGFPTTSSPSCTSPCSVSLSTSVTLRAMALGNGISQSGTTTGAYTLAANTPTIAPASGTYASPLGVTITESTAGTTIYYSTTGFPTTSSPSCASPCSVSLTASATLRAMATGPGISQSATAVASYTITGP